MFVCFFPLENESCPVLLQVYMMDKISLTEPQMGLLVKFPQVERVFLVNIWWCRSVLVRMNTHGNILYFLFWQLHKETHDGISVALLTVDKYDIQYPTGCL